MTKTTLPPLTDRAIAYKRMADMLTYLGDTWLDWPDLEHCARAAGLSASHFQREFTRWAGLSPRQYQAAIAHATAGDLLRQGASIMDAAYETGLSSVSRLHDLFIAHEGLSPGEAKAGGKGHDLSIGRAPTPFGPGVWLTSRRGLVALGFVDDDAPTRTGFVHVGRSEDEAFADLAGRYPDASITRDDKEAERWARRVFEAGEALPVALYGTPFRRQVWRALLDIPAGTTRTYGDVARSIGRPKAARAAGTAIGANPISWFIPCHRAISADRRLHNYHWGIARKRAMLTLEAVHAA
ncbi:MAG: bifunctional helix-turn-helix domain-containing protein/methylated-DNA--[protein]-cysteine S-methyltransferase [Pseudomonadota bacterium]